MTITLDKTVREIAAEMPSSIRVFEALGIDYCCGGRNSLEQACAILHLDVGQVTERLERAAAETNDSDATDWQANSLTELAQYIVRKHHKYVRQELVRLEPLGNKVHDKHAHAHPELKKIIELLLALRDELSMHMTKEEQVLLVRIPLGIESVTIRSTKSVSIPCTNSPTIFQTNSASILWTNSVKASPVCQMFFARKLITL